MIENDRKGVQGDRLDAAIAEMQVIVAEMRAEREKWQRESAEREQAERERWRRESRQEW